MGKVNLFDPFILLGLGAVVALAFPRVRQALKPKATERAMTWKPRTAALAVLTVLATGFPGMVLTVPLLVGLAILSFRAGTAGGTAVVAPHAMPQTTHTQLAALHELFLAGALSRREFDTEKRKLLDGTGPADAGVGAPTSRTAIGWLWAGVVAYGVGLWNMLVAFIVAMAEKEPEDDGDPTVQRHQVDVPPWQKRMSDGRRIIG